MSPSVNTATSSDARDAALLRMGGNTVIGEQTRIPAGWYPDPLGLPQMRWWDAQAWTEHVSDVREPLAPHDFEPAVEQVESSYESRRARREAERALEEPIIIMPSARATTVTPAQTSTDPFEAAAARARQLVAEIESGPTPLVEPAAPDVPVFTTPLVFEPEPVAAPVAPQRDPRLDSTPEIGWAGAALAMHSMRQASASVILTLEVADHESIVVDLRYHAFVWPTPLTEFPAHPRAVTVGVEQTPIDAPPAFELPGLNLDTLLWAIGVRAFADRPAPWLNPELRHTLSRWPNITVLTPSMEQLRMTAMLANAPYTAQELAAAAGAPLTDALNLINAYSLMGILKELSHVDAPPSGQGTSAQPPSRGLFRRLRERLGL